MTDITQQDFNDLQRWEELQQELTALKKEEMALRKRMFTIFFPVHKLGVNNYKLSDDWMLKGTATVRKTIDEAALENILPKLTDGAEDKVIKYKPSIDYKAFEYLDDYDKALLQECIIEKPSTPSLKIQQIKQ